MLPTRRLAELGEPPWPGPVTVCGRVVQWHPQHIDLDDGTAARCLALPPGAAPGPGDHVALVLGADGAPLRLEILAPWAGPGEFPPVSGEWYRLRRDGARRLQGLRRRAALLGEVRRFFADRGFLEIEAPLLVPSPGLELHLDAFPVVTAGALGDGGGTSDGAARADRHLITSPEYQLKRLLSGGMSRIYSLGKVFRRGEAGPQHNPEFTMLEWYRAYEGWEAVAADVEVLCAQLAAVAPCTLGGPRLRSRGLTLDLTPPWPKLTVAEAMARHAGVRLRGDEEPAELRARLEEAGHDPRGAASWDDLFFSVFLDHVEPRLGAPDAQGLARPLVLHDWPRPLCALARPKPGAPEVVERFEAYVAGLELCNGFGELCDPAEQRRRFDADLAERRRRGLPLYPVDERFLAALEEGLPPSGGVALGVDRLIMLLCDAQSIRDVLPFAADEL